jgi:DNA-binding MarR family transcriptional regulator
MSIAADASAPVGVPDIGPAIGLAENEMTRLLIDVLAQTGTPENVWYAFRRLSGFAAPPSPAAFRQDVGDALGLDEQAAAALLDEGVALGLLCEVTDPADGSPRVALTSAGEAARGRIRASVTAVITDLVASLDPQDVRTTVQTLTALTNRARTLRTTDQVAETSSQVAEASGRVAGTSGRVAEAFGQPRAGARA